MAKKKHILRVVFQRQARPGAPRVSKTQIFKKKGGLEYPSNVFRDSFHHPGVVSKNMNLYRGPKTSFGGLEKYWSRMCTTLCSTALPPPTVGTVGYLHIQLPYWQYPPLGAPY